ncbi:UTRA domain-containing protein [Microbulbifer taiwanensis]|uniref:UTRA domain-containing protein n=1 Tax=Microbulbifer taiwanensis TaxID=986746 RepID=A0ABW1YML5_9GAMM|nr:UTRA domain-containing protein [Microbulbifer taiwanensis]
MSSAYDDIKAHIQHLISDGRLGANHKLPSERELVEQLPVTRITLRDGLTRLEGEGLVYRQNRRGWFVAPNRFVMKPAQKVNFNRMAGEQGFQPGTEVLHLRRQAVRRDIYTAFEAGKNSRYFELRRVRSLDNRAVMVEDSYMPVERYTGLNDFDLSESVTEILQQHYGVEVASEHCNIQIANLERVHAEPLGIHAGTLGLKIVRLRYGPNGQLIDYNIEHWLPHAIEMEVATR